MSKWLWLVVFLLALGALGGVFFTYLYWFKIKLGFHTSHDPEVWGQFGDFVGGILNPILSFITVLILIVTSLYQQKQYENSEKRESNKRFDDRFYGMITYQRSFAYDFKCKLPTGDDANLKELVIHLEKVIFDTTDHNEINTIHFKETVFPLIRSFYILTKMINQSQEDKVAEKDIDKYYEWLINLSDYYLVRLVLLCIFYYDNTVSFEYIKSTPKFIEKLTKLGWGTYISDIKQRKVTLSINNVSEESQGKEK